ncbi:MAG: protein-export chaperone SecB [Proteobacteria bacterium]|nr:protein-export chaperone SecB [Pseudomonadota bacterium]
MTDVPSPPAPPPSGFAVNAQYIRDLSFEGPAHPKDVQSNEPPKIDVNVTAQTRSIDAAMFEVSLNVRAQALVAGKNAFLVELAYAAVITPPPGLSEENLRYLTLAEVPRYLFPFARAIVANTTREGGFPPLLLQPIDFNALYQNQMRAADISKAAGTA